MPTLIRWSVPDSTACATLCSWTCANGTLCATTCSNSPAWITLYSQTATTTSTLTNVWWMDDDVAEYVTAGRPAQRLPTDQERYERAVAEHNDQEAERLRRVIVERERIAAEQRQRATEATARRNAAHTRAKELLFEHLTPKQRETFDKNGWFVVEGGRSKQTYRINIHSSSGNIEIMQGRRATHRLCCHCSDRLIPLHDQLLAQKLMLEFAEDDFLRLANRTAA